MAHPATGRPSGPCYRCLAPGCDTALSLPLGSDRFMSHWLSHSAAAVRDMQYRDVEADTVLQVITPNGLLISP